MYCSRCGTWAPDDHATCGRCGLALQVDNWGAAPPSPALAPVVSIVAYGGFWRRFAGWLIDGIVFVFPGAIVRVLLGLSAWPHWREHESLGGLAFTIQLVIEWLYVALLQSSRAGATLGQQVMDLRLTDLDGARVSFLRATARYAATWLVLPTLGFSYLIQVLTRRRQTLHDMVAGTLVVRGLATPPRTPVAAPVALRP